ncbi:hypothetical protein SynBIOSE41_04220 [Synechococcus sp. BIOS-E4-1]|nr:hypothetical protein SynBIOSE41_04220 [Synechococcus sp. BIOS-E4-1]
MKERPSTTRNPEGNFLLWRCVRSGKRLFWVETRTDSSNAFHF